MQARRFRPNMAVAIIAFAVLFGAMLICARALQAGGVEYWSVSKAGDSISSVGSLPEENLPAQAPAGLVEVLGTPTPDPPHPLPPIRNQVETYTIRSGDSLGAIAQEFGVSLQQLIAENALENPDHVEVGMLLTIPVPNPQTGGPDFKVIPDSELVYGPGSMDFDVPAFVRAQGGYLNAYYEEVDEKTLTGGEVILRVAQDYSVNPRLLLALLEYQSGWVTQADPQLTPVEYPLDLRDPWRKGLYRQLAWAANALNRGFYVWRVNGVATWVLADSSVVPISPVINAGTAAIQNYFSAFEGHTDWGRAVTAKGLYATYTTLFGNPFSRAVEPLIPPELTQPNLQLPFEDARVWSFTGGPHGSWGSGSAWGALDFAPPSEMLGCVSSDEWVTAMADGVIVRTGLGTVIQDLSGTDGSAPDGLEGTGWVILYMHIESRDRVAPGTFVRAGERIGHPSCEGGVSTGTHVHVARKYNGEWIPADQDLPFNLQGWISSGDGFEYNGYLTLGGQSIEAFAGRSDDNNIQR
jgi:murein DD-endopeptidase MepM/ murein hydrolase activator NlpD